MADFNYANLKGVQDTRAGGIAQYVLEEFEKMKLHRQYKEVEWIEANKAYQTVIDSIKSTFDPNQAPEIQFRDFYKKNKMSDIKLPVEFAIIQRKLTYILSNKPQAKWVAMGLQKDSEQQNAGKIFGYAFDYAWYTCDGDWEEFKAILSSLIYSIGYLHWWYEYCAYDVEVPDTAVNGVIEYKKVHKIVSQARVEHLDERHVFLDYNASDLSLIRKGGFIKHYGKSEFKRLFKRYPIENIQPISPIECFLKVGEERTSQQKDVFETLYYYDEVLDRYAIVVNGFHINPYAPDRLDPDNKGWSPIPAEEKKFPVAFFIDHYLDSELYAMGEARLAKPFRELKNKTRNMVFDVMKKIAFHTLVIDPLSDFNEDEFEFGQPFIRAELDSVKNLPVSADLGFSVNMDTNINNDIAMFSGINIMDTGNPTQDETATKTASRRESQFSMIETYIKQNMSYGWKRIWMGFKENVYMAGRAARLDTNGNVVPWKIRTDGVKIYRNNNKITEQKKEGSYFFDMLPKDFNYEMELVPEIGNIAYTSELEDEKKREGLTILESAAYGPDVVDKFKVGAMRAELHGLPADVIKNAPSAKPGQVDLTQDPKDLTKNLNLLAKPPQYDEMAAKLNGEVANPEAATPSGSTAGAGALPGIQPTDRGNPAVVR